MKKRIISFLCAAIMLLLGTPKASAGYENFTAQRQYSTGQFLDVKETDWFEINLKSAYEFNLIDGKSSSYYMPESNLTIAEAVKLAACLHKMYTAGNASFEASHPWYNTYADYARGNGILDFEPENFDSPASRAQFAKIFAHALPASALTRINNVVDGGVGDVPIGSEYENAVYILYRAGVLTGSDSEGNFYPKYGIKRSEAATIVARMANPTLRKRVTLTEKTASKATASNTATPTLPYKRPDPLPSEPVNNPPSTATTPSTSNSALHPIMPSANEKKLTMDEVSRKCAPSVFKIETYNSEGSMIGTGSGVSISADGLAVTCAHVVNGCASAVAKFPNGVDRQVRIYGLDSDNDIALLQITGASIPHIDLGGGIEKGSTVYALGYPNGGMENIAAGKVKNPNNTDYLVTMIETSVRVFSGNSGGALLDSYGRLVGVVSSSEQSGTPSFAVPVTLLENMDASKALSLSDYNAAHKPDASLCYTGLYPVPDFGKVLNAPLAHSSHENGEHTFIYRKADMSADTARASLLYNQALNRNTFYIFNEAAYSSSAGYEYSVILSDIIYQGAPSLSVTVFPRAKAQLSRDASLPEIAQIPVAA